MSQTIAEGHERELDEADLWECHPDDQPDKLHAEFSAVWDAEKRANAAAPSLFRALFRVCWPRLAALTLINIVGRVSGFAGPLLLQAVLRYLEDPAAPASTGYALAVCMFAVGLLSAIVNSQAMQVQMRGWTRVRAVCSLLVYRKTLRLTAASQAESSSGQVVNLMSSDAEKVGMMMFGLADPVLVPVQLAIYLVLIFQLLGTATWSGFGVMLGAFPVMALIMVGVAVATRDKSALADTRVRLMNEVLQVRACTGGCE